uniref:Integral membrane protein 2 n=1 Tax=Panstrongylus megistus TaxID=65343 RepID=A0A069DRS8_9HEMI
MTIVTKPLSEKKNDKNQAPLVDEVKIEVLPERCTEPGRPVPPIRSVAFRELVRERRVNSASTACLFLTALLVMSCGVITGLYLYKQFVRAQMQKFHGWCSIPYEENSYTSGLLRQTSVEIDNLRNEEDLNVLKKMTEHLLANKGEPIGFYHEEFEIDDTYEKISVPEFSGGKNSRFVHDFSINKTAIVDTNGGRCFIMPLNRSTVLPPATLVDLVKKMREGHYDVNTDLLRETMRVITPAIKDRDGLGQIITRECNNYPIYKLEKYVNGVYKRSAESEAQFMEFAGRTQIFHIVNYADLEEQAPETPVAMA